MDNPNTLLFGNDKNSPLDFPFLKRPVFSLIFIVFISLFAFSGIEDIEVEFVQKEYSKSNLVIEENNKKDNPQFIILSFDGGRSLSAWRDTLDFAKEMRGWGKEVHFTYYISGTYLIPETEAYFYEAPNHLPGDIAIDFAKDWDEIKKRAFFVSRAIKEGHEIGSHAVGHFAGNLWSLEDWNKENKSFNDIWNNFFNYFIDKEYSNLKPNSFRAPELARNENLFKSLSQNQYRYDSSVVALSPVWPYKIDENLWEIPLSYIKFPTFGYMIAMDYNLYLAQTNAQNRLIRGTKDWQDSYEETINAYKNAFYERYNGSRIPFSIGHHFSLWNDGLYWQAMKDFAEEVCGLQDVRCVTGNELIDYMEDKIAQ